MLSISQFSRVSHISPKTLRYYDEIDLLKPQEVNQENGYRYYSSEQLITALKIQKLKQYEFRLAEIRLALTDELYLHDRLLEKAGEIQQKIVDYHDLQAALEGDLATLAAGGNFLFNQETEKITYHESVSWQIISIRKTINVKDFSQLLQEVLTLVELKQATTVYAPITIYHSMEYTPDHYDVEVAIPILEKNLATRQLIAQGCVSYHFKGNYQKLPAAYAQLGKWVDEHQYEVVDPFFEVYLTDPSVTPADENEVVIYLPVKER